MNDCMENEIKNNLNYFRGIMAIVVLLSHLWFSTGYAFLIIFNKVVTIAVSYFFFCISIFNSLQSEISRKIFE